MTGGAPPPAPDVPGSLIRPTLAVVAFTALSRATGFVRILVVAAVLGQTFLGNTYQTANTIPNVVFELVVAGALQAVLIPTLVETLDRGGQTDAERIAGGVLGISTLVLSVLAAAGMLASPWIMRALTLGVADAEVREDQIRLGTVFLLIFLPQVVFYAAGLVATGVLNSRDRFALPAFAPVVNNLVVTASYLAFGAMRAGRAPSLDLSGAEIAVLAGGTTFGVVAFTAVPVIAVVRSGFGLRPSLSRAHAGVGRILRQGRWAAVFVAASQVQLVVVLMVANRIEGGVVTYQIGYTFLLLPHALLAVPIATTTFPRLARSAGTPAFAERVERGLRAIAYVTIPAAAAMAALAAPIADLALFGRSGARVGAVAGVLVWFAPGVVGFGATVFLARAWYALDRPRTPAIVGIVTVVTGAIGVVIALPVLGGEARVPALAAMTSATLLATALALGALMRAGSRRSTAWWARCVVSGALAGVAMRAIAAAISNDALALATGVAAGAMIYTSVLIALRGPSPRAALALLQDPR